MLKSQPVGKDAVTEAPIWLSPGLRVYLFTGIQKCWRSLLYWAHWYNWFTKCQTVENKKEEIQIFIHFQKKLQNPRKKEQVTKEFVCSCMKSSGATSHACSKSRGHLSEESETKEEEGYLKTTFSLNGTCNTSLENVTSLKVGLPLKVVYLQYLIQTGTNSQPKIKFYIAPLCTINRFYNTFSVWH